MQKPDLPKGGSPPNFRSLKSGRGVAAKERAVLLPVKRRNQTMKVQIGDVLQVDGGLVIIKEVETVRAFCLPLPGFKNLKADIFKHGFGVEQASRNVLERRGEAGLAAFLAEQKQGKQAERNSMVRLEPGDALCYHGHRCTVVAVVEDGALLQNAAGEEFEEAREVNEFLFQDCSCKGHVAGRLDAAGRAENLKQHLAARAAASQAAAANGPAAVTVNNNTETKKETPVMKKAKAEKEVKAVKAEKPSSPVASGRETDEQVLAFIASARKADPDVAPSALTKAFRADGRSCSNERMAKLAKG